MIKRSIFPLLLIILSVSFQHLSAQTKITGVIRDAVDYTLLGEVNVRVLKLKDSTVVKGTVSDVKGIFLIEGVPPGSYNLDFSMVGYLNQKRKIQIIKENAIINIDTIKMRSEFKTGEIKVESDMPEMRFEDEKKVFTVENMTTTKGGTALDVLRKIPLVDVDLNDNITLRGSTKLLILIDNKPMRFPSLRQVPAEAIKDVEIITNPSAKYEAEGVTGIINLVMQAKNEDVVGYNGYLYTGFRSDVKGGYGSIGINLKTNNWSFFLNGGGGIFAFDNHFNSNTYYEIPVSQFAVSSDGSGKSRYGYASFGAEYEFRKGHAIGTELNLNPGNFNSDNNGQNKNFNSTGLLTSYYTSGYNSEGPSQSWGASLYYNGKFDKIGRELNLEAYFGKDNNKNSSAQYQQYFDSLIRPIPNPSKQNSYTTNTNQNINLQADYTHPFNDKTKFETGYKGNFRMNDNDYSYDTLNYFINEFVRNSSLTNRFKLDDYINAFYATFSHKINDFKIKLGLRMENTHTAGNLITTNYEFTKDYLNLFPTVSLSQKLGKMNEFQISYSRRITRPNIWRLNPFVNKYNARFISFGNPELNPEFTDSYEFNHNLFTDYGTLTTSVFFRKSYDVISNFSYLQDSITTVTTYRNGAGSKSYGTDFILRTSAIKWITLNATISMYQTNFDGSVLNEFKGEEGFTWRARIRSTIKISDWFNVEAYYNYSGKKFTSTGFNYPNQSFDLALSKNLLKNKIMLSIRAEDIFQTRKWGGENNGIGFSSVNSSKWDSRILYINFSYNFGNTDKYYQKSKKTKQNENENQDTQNNNQQ